VRLGYIDVLNRWHGRRPESGQENSRDRHFGKATFQLRKHVKPSLDLSVVNGNMLLHMLRCSWTSAQAGFAQNIPRKFSNGADCDRTDSGEES